MDEIKTAFITGAASGIGEALARQLGREGVALYLTDIDDTALKVLAEDLAGQQQATVHWGRLDVADRSAFEREAVKAKQSLGDIDAVFNNAGVALADQVSKGSYDDHHWLMNINYWGVVHGTKAFLSDMLRRDRGHIVNVSSVFGLFGVASQSAYCSAKHAVKGFSESLYHELRGTGVYVHTVHPGGIKTNIARNARNRMERDRDISPDEAHDRFTEMAPTTPEQAARIILKGVRAGRFKILVGRDARFMDRIVRWFPNYWLNRLSVKLLAAMK